MHLNDRISLRPWAAMTLALTVTASLLAGCGGEVVEELPPVIRPVKSMVVGFGSSIALSYPGRVQSADRVELSFRVSGPVIELPVNEGQKVEKGTRIARIDPRDYQIAVDEAAAAFEKAESDLVRYQRLYEQNAVPLSDLEFYQAQRDVASARLNQAKANLEYTRLKAPFTGEIGQKYIEQSENVGAGQPVVSLHGTDQIEVVIDLPEAYRAYFDAQAIRVNKLAAAFDFAPDRDFALTLKEIASRADPTTRTYRATFSMPQPEGLQIRPGMTASVVLEAEANKEADDGEPASFIVPGTAVGTDDAGEQFLWIIDETDFTVHQRPVTVGDVTGAGSIIIRSGLEGGERIAVAAVSRLREGMRVRPWDE